MRWRTSMIYAISVPSTIYLNILQMFYRNCCFLSTDITSVIWIHLLLVIQFIYSCIEKLQLKSSSLMANGQIVDMANSLSGRFFLVGFQH